MIGPRTEQIRGLEDRIASLEKSVSSLQSALNNKVNVTNGIVKNLTVYQSDTLVGKAVESLGVGQCTVYELIEKVRYSNGVMGSVNLTGPSPILADWYHFIYIPHRSGGTYGQASADNCNYGTLLLFNLFKGKQTWYMVHYNAPDVEIREYS